MLIKTFLETAGNFDEREILTKFHFGITKSVFGSTDIVQDLFNTTGVYLDLGDSYSHCDVAVMLGSWKPRDKAHHNTRSSIAESARCFVIVETPLLGRVMFQKNKHFRIGVNGYLNNSGVFRAPGNCPPDRFNDLGIKWSGWKNKQDGEILIMLQLPGDASLRGISIYDWVKRTVEHVRKISDRPIRIRTHPGHGIKDTDEFHRLISELIMFKPVKDLQFSIGREVPLANDLDKSYCTITYSSGSGIDSILNGIPTIATDPGNFAWEISTNYIDQVDNIKKPNDAIVLQWLYNLAYSQWTVEEMGNGTVWKHLTPIINRVIENLTPVKKKK